MTNKYTKLGGLIVSDFNEALGNLFSNTSFQSIISDIEDNQEMVSSLM